MSFKPSHATVLSKFVYRLGPQPTTAHLLSHLGDKDTIIPFSPGEEPCWLEVLAWLLSANPHITVQMVVDELNRRSGE